MEALKKLFTVTFQKELDDTNRGNIIDSFYSNLQEDWYKEIDIREDTRIVVNGDFFRYRLKAYGLLNLWTRFIRKAEVSVTHDSVKLIIDNSYGYFSLFTGGIIFFFFIALMFQQELTWRYFLYFILFFSCFSIIYSQLIVYLQRRFFKATIKYGKHRYFEKYDWKNILKDKSIEEMKDIAYGRIITRPEMRELAKKELEERRSKGHRTNH